MELDGRVAVITGGGSGIGAALATAAAAGGARVAVADLDGERAQAVADAIPDGRAIALGADVTGEAAIERLLVRTERELGPVDLFFANAGVATGIGLGAADEEWQRSLDVNLMAHVRAARLLVPRWEGRGGYFIATASAAGLLTQIGCAPYAATKHAAVGFAEWLAITYGDVGIRVSCLCPMGVRTPLLDTGFDPDRPADNLAARTVTSAGAVLEPADVAKETLAGIAEERFLILPHPEVLDYFRHKGTDYQRWIDGMRRVQQRTVESIE